MHNTHTHTHTHTMSDDICIPKPDVPANSSSHGKREAPSVKHITDLDIKRAEAATGLKAKEYGPSSAPLRPGSLRDTHQDVHGLHKTFTGESMREVDLSRPPFAKKLPEQVMRQMIDWERVKAEQFDTLRSDPVYQFLSMIATTSQLDVQELIQSKTGPLAVGSEFVESREEAEITETPQPDVQQQLPRRRRRKRSPPQIKDEDLLTDVEHLRSGARARKQQAPMLFIREDLSRAERRQAFDAQSWLRQVEVIGRFAISDRALTAINHSYGRILMNVPRLNGVHVRHFMFDEYVNSYFAMLCGLYLNYLDFMSRRSYVEISMNNIEVKSMDNLVLFFLRSVMWNADSRRLVVMSVDSFEPGAVSPYHYMSEGCLGQSAVVFSGAGTSVCRQYPVLY